MMKAQYAMANRWPASAPQGVEVIFYTANFERISKVLMAQEWAESLPVEWLSPMQVYSKTKGTMGLTSKGENHGL